MCVCQLCFKWVSLQHNDRQVIASPEISMATALAEKGSPFIEIGRLDGQVSVSISGDGK